MNVDVGGMLGVPRASLNISGAVKGAVSGRLRFQVRNNNVFEKEGMTSE